MTGRSRTRLRARTSRGSPAADRGDARGRHGPAFYARQGGTVAGWWTVLHPPYTAWHLAYVAIGAALAPTLDLGVLAATLAAFFLAVGVAAHALDELQGRPLGTALSDHALRVAAAVSLGGAVLLGVVGIRWVGWILAPLIVLGTALVVLYNRESFGGRFHSDAWFAAAWGAFPVVVGYVGQTGRVHTVAIVAAAAAFACSWAQRALSTPARWLRRRVDRFEVEVEIDGERLRFGPEVLRAPIEQALKAMTWTVVLLAVALVLARVT